MEINFFFAMWDIQWSEELTHFVEKLSLKTHKRASQVGVKEEKVKKEKLFDIQYKYNDDDDDDDDEKENCTHEQQPTNMMVKNMNERKKKEEKHKNNQLTCFFHNIQLHSRVYSWWWWLFKWYKKEWNSLARHSKMRKKKLTATKQKINTWTVAVWKDI
jgi:hypothetical protein